MSVSRNYNINTPLVKHPKKAKEESIMKKEDKRNLSEKLSCWKGYERVPGTKAGKPGSCRKKKKKR